MQVSETACSFLNDPEVPAFDTPEHFTVMDAQCGLCTKGALWIAKHDHEKKFRIIPIQSDLGGALLRHYGMAPDDPVSWLYICEGRAYTSLDAIVRVGKEFGGIWKILAVLNVLPKRLQDGLYGAIARNRHRFLGRRSFCDTLIPEIQNRILQ